MEYVEFADGIRRSKADYTYGYGPALRDHVVRPVIFMAYSGQMRWQTSTGDVMEAQLGEAATKDITAQAWRTALNPEGEWIPSVLRAADRRLTEVRRNVPDAGALVIATDHEDARAYAAQLRAITGEEVTIVLSDDKGASERIEDFAAGTQRWMVAVRMVSEGVDVPRLCVGVYATSTSTPLFFAQAVGRFVRSRRRGETASVFLPSVPQLMLLANEMEAERDHALDRPEQLPASRAWRTSRCPRGGPARGGQPAGQGLRLADPSPIQGAGVPGRLRPGALRRRRVRHRRGDRVRG